jgi:hypothetical protein
MTMKAKFPGTCKTCKRSFQTGATIDWKPGVGATHASAADCAAALVVPVPVPAVAPGVALDMKPVADFLARAAGKLKFPKVVFLAPGGGELKLYVAGARSTFPGSIQVLVNGEWLGRVTVEGEAHGRKLTGDAAMIAAINTVALDPAKAAKDYAALRGCCSFCAKPLTDDGSIEVGYGPICAKHYGLPWKSAGTKVLAAAPVKRTGLTELAALLSYPEGGAR